MIDSLKPGGRCGIVLDECDLWCLVSLPAGTFVNAGAGVKTNLLFFPKGRPTECIWYYDLSEVKVGKKSPLTLSHFEEFFGLLPAKSREDTRTPEELLDIVEAKGREVAEAIAPLRKMLG